MDLTKWLQQDMGLKDMIEADLTELVTHPRHGTLCRKFLQFLVDSTLCSRKYPNVNVSEDIIKAEQDLKMKEENLETLMDELEIRKSQNEDYNFELHYLKSRQEYLKNINDLRKTSGDALEQMLDRPHLRSIEQVGKLIDENEYLIEANLKKRWFNPTTDIDSISIEDDETTLTQKIEQQVKEVKMMHKIITDRLRSIQTRMASLEGNLEPKNVPVNMLNALKIPKYEEVIIDKSAEEQGVLLKNRNVQLHLEVSELIKRVSALVDQYRSERSKILSQHKRRIQESKDFVDEVEKIISQEKQRLQ